MITFDDFKKTEIMIGEIISVEKILNSTRLFKLIVNFGEEMPRQIVSGIAPFFPEPTELVGKKCAFITNLEPRIILGNESNGMILAASSDNGIFSLLEVNKSVMPGTKIK